MDLRRNSMKNTDVAWLSCLHAQILLLEVINVLLEKWLLENKYSSSCF
jgi:hypothetical protein